MGALVPARYTPGTRQVHRRRRCQPRDSSNQVTVTAFPAARAPEKHGGRRADTRGCTPDSAARQAGTRRGRGPSVAVRGTPTVTPTARQARTPSAICTLSRSRAADERWAVRASHRSAPHLRASRAVGAMTSSRASQSTNTHGVVLLIPPALSRCLRLSGARVRCCIALPQCPGRRALSRFCRAVRGTGSARWRRLGPPPRARGRQRCGTRPAGAR